MKKTDEAYKSIGEVARILNLVNKKSGSLNTHTIRFWEKEFRNINPKILSGRRRYYDEKTINLLKKVNPSLLSVIESIGSKFLISRCKLCISFFGIYGGFETITSNFLCGNSLKIFIFKN